MNKPTLDEIPLLSFVKTKSGNGVLMHKYKGCKDPFVIILIQKDGNNFSTKQLSINTSIESYYYDTDKIHNFFNY